MQPPQPDYCLFFIDSWFTCMQKAEWASWMQAVFSVLAIIVAIGIAIYQHEKQRRQQAERDRAAAVVVSAGQNFGVAIALTIIQHLKNQITSSRKSGIRPDMNAALESLDSIELPKLEEILVLSTVLPRGSVALAESLKFVSQLRVHVARMAEAGPTAIPVENDLPLMWTRQFCKFAIQQLQIASEELMDLHRPRVGWMRRKVEQLLDRLLPSRVAVRSEAMMKSNVFLDTLP